MKKKTLLSGLFVLMASIIELQAQPIAETVNDKAELRYGNTKIEMERHLENKYLNANDKTLIIMCVPFTCK